MNCQECQDNLGAFVDGALVGPERNLIQAHIGGCAACGASAARLLRLQTLVPAEARLSADFDNSFYKKLALERPNRLRTWFKFLEPLLVASCAAMIFLFSVTRPSSLGADQAFIAQNREMLSQLDLALQLPQLRPEEQVDFEVISHLGELQKPGGAD